MSSAVWHELGDVAGGCTVCGAEGGLTLGEARFHRNLLERLRGQYCAPPARFVTCSGCGWRWSVRADDTSADGVRRRSGTPRAGVARREDVVAPAEAAACRTTLPSPRRAHGSRDWTYPRS